MPRPLRPCIEPGCPRPAQAGNSRCAEHAKERDRAYDRRRPNRHARGYDARWQKIRDAFLKAHPWCMEPGCCEPATDVDHIVSRTRGGTDDDSNLQSLCHSHHTQKTNRQDGGGWRHGG